MSGSGGRGKGGYRDALAQPDYRRLVLAFIVDSIGGWAYTIVLSVYVFDRTHSAAWVTAFLCAAWVPKFFVAPHAGVLADRYERVFVMQASALSAFAVMTGLTVGVLLDAPLLVLLVVSGAAAVCVAPYRPASAALLVDVVDERSLTAANSLFVALESVVVIVGPALGGALLLVADPGVVVEINALSFLGAALVLARLGTRSVPGGDPDAEREGVTAQLVSGVRALRGQPIALTLLLYCLLCTGICGTTTVLFVKVSSDRLGTGATGLSYLLAAFAAGGVLSAFATDKLSAGRLGPLVVAGIVLESLPLAALALTSNAVVGALLLAVSGAGMVVVDVLAITALQREISRDLLGRVFGLLDCGGYAASIGGSLLASALIGVGGLEVALVGIGIASAALAVVGVRPLLAADRRAATELAALEPKIALLSVLDLFAAASRPVLEQLARAVEEVELPGGATVIAEGDTADALYVLVSGEVAVSALGEAGIPRQLRTMGPRSVFGEIGVLRRIPRTATVQAVEPCRLWRVSSQAFADAVESAPVSSSLLGLAGDRLARTHPTLAARPLEEPVPA